MFGLRQTRLNGIITSPYPEVTLDTFGFLIGAHSADRQAVVCRKLKILGQKCILLHCISWHRMILHGIELYLMVLHCILWYCIVSYGIALVLYGISLYCMVLQDVALYCTVLYKILRYCIVDFGARAVSRKTPIYFILYCIECY